MSQLTHAQPRPVRLRLPLRLSLAAVALIAGAAIALVLVISGGDDAARTPDTAVQFQDSPATHAHPKQQPGVQQPPGTRYDGGPEEGTSAVRPAASKPQSPASSLAPRYDGGPEEGTSGVHGSSPSSSTAPGIRYDGGPEEGSALAR